MPTYEYECEACRSTYEVEQKIDDPRIEKCQTDGCEGTPKRLISQTSFVLNGGGWYRDGYR